MNKFINTFKEIIKYCSKANIKSLAKLLGELVILVLIITIFKLPFIMIRDFGIELFTSLGLEFNKYILLGWNILFELSYLIIGIMIFINIINKRYENINEQKKDL